MLVQAATRKAKEAVLTAAAINGDDVVPPHGVESEGKYLAKRCRDYAATCGRAGKLEENSWWLQEADRADARRVKKQAADNALVQHFAWLLKCTPLVR